MVSLKHHLKKLATIQKKHTKLLAVISILMTIVLGIGLKDLSINSDIRSELHTDAPIYKLNDLQTDCTPNCKSRNKGLANNSSWHSRWIVSYWCAYCVLFEEKREIMIRIKKIFDEPDENDGFRMLVDRLWARGLSKMSAKIDLWLKDIAFMECIKHTENLLISKIHIKRIGG